MIIGYARISTIDQVIGLKVQLRELQSDGCAKIFKEQRSSVDTRLQLESAIEFIREGDVLVVAKLDRLARFVSGLMKIIGELENKKVSLRILNLGMDTSTPTGKLMLTILGGIAQCEREIMLERQLEGIAKAKSEGKYKGGKSIQSGIKQQVIQLVASGESKVEVARKLGIGEATVYRILKS
jgi:DNA invertase Pin-like site-specific DNA recombinase